MAEYIEPGPICDTAGIREAVCIHTRKIFDSCRDKDIASLISFYLYCHPYSAFERGNSGNGNRMIRRGVPKEADFTGITEAAH